jgi:hypothetical protein
VIPATPIQALTNFLRNTGASYVNALQWGQGACPFYQKVPEPAPPFPYCLFTVPRSSIQHVLASGTVGGSYIETRKPKIQVVGTSDEIELVSAPEVNGSVFWLLDALADTPDQLSGQGFACEQFTREYYSLDVLEDERSEQYKRVWIAEAEYTLITVVPYPIRRIP